MQKSIYVHTFLRYNIKYLYIDYFYKNKYNIFIGEYMDNTLNYEKKKFKDEFNFYKLFWIFYIGGISGVIVETIWCILTNGYFEYRTALILEPINPVYGVGALIISLLLYNLKKYNNFVLYSASFIIGGIFETLCSLFQELLFGTVSWMYKPSNLGILGNRTSLIYCFFWGFLGIIWIRVIYPFLSKIVDKFYNNFTKVLTFILVTLLSIDIIFSSGALLRQKERRNKIPPQNSIDKFYDINFSDNVLKFFYHNITVID